MINTKQLYFPAIMMVILFTCSGVLFYKQLSESYTEFVKHELEIEIDSVVQAMVKSLPSFSEQVVNDYLDDIPFSERMQRFSLLNLSGDIIADSSLSLSQIARLVEQTEKSEIMLALKNGIGSDIRMNKSKGSEYLFVAKTIYTPAFNGIARLAVPMEYIYKTTYQFISLYAFLMIATVIIVLIFTVFNNTYLARSIKRCELSYQNQFLYQKREVELLHRLSSLLAACNNQAEAQQVVSDIVPKVLGDLNGCVAMMRSSRNLLEVKLDWGGEWSGDKVYAPDSCWALRKGKYHFAHDELTTMPCSHMCDDFGIQTLCIPLIAHGDAIGMMHLILDEQLISEAKKNLCFTVAEHIGLAMANLQLQDKLRQQALRDPLTGLFNRRYLEEKISQEFNIALKKSTPLSVLMVDMDHFKRFNDNFGHDAGDYVLKLLANELLNQVAEDDSVCRIGGEEIAILLPSSEAHNAIKTADKICSAIREMNPKFNGQTLGKLSVSIGIATYPDSAQTTDALIKEADIALYKAKDNGRDQCIHNLIDTSSDHQ